MKWLLLIGCLISFSCRKKEETTKPTIQPITESVYASGKVKSNGQYEVYSAVSGIVRHIAVTEGSEVKEGDVLMTIINDVALLHRENALLATNYQSIQANRDRLDEARVAIDFSSAKMLNDSLLFERQRRLWDNGIGSRNDLEQRELAVKNSGTAYQTAVLRYQQLKKSVAFADRQARNELRISNVLSNDYSIRAKRNGRVYAVNKEVGELVTQQLPVAILGDAAGFVLELQVDECDISRISEGQQVFITMDSYKGQVFEATVSKKSLLMNERSRSVTVEAIFVEQPAALLPNLSVEGNILIRSKQKALTIPRSYLADNNFVILQDGGKKKVSVGLKDYQWVEITGGLGLEDVIKKASQ